MGRVQTWARAGVVMAALSALLVSGCSSSSESTTPAAEQRASAPAETSGRAVTKFEVITQLEPLTKAVVAYTDTDYGDEVGSPDVLAQVESNLGAVQTQEETWLDFASQINYDGSGISGLEQAVDGYNSGLNAWQANQDRGLANWKRCATDGGGDFAVAACMLKGYSLEDEQQALSAYTTPLKNLLKTVGAM